METPPQRLLPPALAAVTLCLAACAGPDVKKDAPPARSAAPAWETDNPLLPLPSPPLGVPVDFAELPFKVTPEKVRLGRWLFFDKRLSADGTVSCGSCHRPENAFSEPTPHSTGVGGKAGTRKALPLVNAAFPIDPVWFWDGRATSLLEQAKGPVLNSAETDASPGHVALAVGKIGSYRRYFREAFGDDHLDAERVAEAIAAYEATRLSGNSTFDRFDAGDETALSAEQRLGRDLFFGRARCSACHLGFTFTDSRFHNLGVGYAAPPAGQDPRSGFRDLGRFEVTKEASDAGAFKTPTLRDCARRAPYMHDGSVPTLREAVLHHERGGIQNPWLDPEMKELNLSPKAVDALVAFLRALDGEGYEDSPPRSFPR